MCPNWSKLIQMGANRLKWVQIASNMSKLFHICPIRYRWVQMSPNWSKLVPMGPNWSKQVQIGSTRLQKGSNVRTCPKQSNNCTYWILKKSKGLKVTLNGPNSIYKIIQMDPCQPGLLVQFTGSTHLSTNTGR